MTVRLAPSKPTRKPARWSSLVPTAKVAIVRRAMREAGGNVSKAAVLLGLQRTTLSMFLSQHADKLKLDTIACPHCKGRVKVPRRLSSLSSLANNHDVLTGSDT